MPIIFLSPSTQEYNPYITGGNEELYMNRIADAMEPYLRSNAIRWNRNTPDMTAASSIALAAKGSYDFYLALHSNASGDGTTEGRTRGIIAFYYPTSASGRRAAELFAENLRRIYPLPDRVTTRSTTTLGEVRRPRSPAVLIEIGYHDNTADATWVSANVTPIARCLAESLCQYFGLPFIEARAERQGTVATQSSPLNLRAYPAATGAVITTIPRGAAVTVTGSYQGWYTVWYEGYAGYASAAYIQLT